MQASELKSIIHRAGNFLQNKTLLSRKISRHRKRSNRLAPMRRTTVIAKQRIHIKIHWLANKFGPTLSQ
jgi:hypothetical protein